MQFTVPQFIEHEPKIIGQFTLRQFFYIGIAAAIIFTLYFTFGKTNFLIFLMFSMIIGTLAIGLAFIKVNQKPLPAVLLNIFSFSMKPKIYLWHRKETPIRMIKLVAKKPVAKEEEKGTVLKMASKSHLKDLAKSLETR